MTMWSMWRQETGFFSSSGADVVSLLMETVVEENSEDNHDNLVEG